MQTLEGADVIFLNGAGLEEAMESALSAVDGAHIIDCSEGIELLAAGEHHADSSHEEADPHIWMDPNRACAMLTNIADGLASLDPDHADAFQANAQAAAEQIRTACTEMKAQLANLPTRDLITFHDGFQYFSQAFDLTILRAIEEEAGSEASAKEVGEIMAEVEQHRLPAVFTESNGSTATAEMIARECGIGVASLDLIMSRAHDGSAGIGVYLSRLADNVTTIREAYS